MCNVKIQKLHLQHIREELQFGQIDIYQMIKKVIELIDIELIQIMQKLKTLYHYQKMNTMNYMLDTKNKMII